MLKKNEPDWIEHDGSDVCPVPAEHDVELKWGDGDITREPTYTAPEVWNNEGWEPSMQITHYRDWTAFEQQQASAGEVPEIVPDKAEFFVAPYEDCGTPRVTVKYDTTGDTCRENVWVETGYGGNWIAFEADIADDVCAAIQAAARAIRARGVTAPAAKGEGA